MKRKNISETIDNINPKYIDEATEYAGAGESTRKKAWYKKVSPIAAAMCLCLAAVVMAFVLPEIIGPYHQYKRISFSTEMLGDKLDIMDTTLVKATKVECVAKESYFEKMPVYKITPRNISQEEFKTMVDFLGIEGEIQSDYDSKLNPVLRVHSDKKHSDLHGNEFAFWQDTGIRKPMTQTDAELEAAAREVFNTLPLIEGEYEYLGVTSEQTVHSSDGDYIESKRVSFRRLIDGVRVIGNDICDLYFDSNGLWDIEIKFYNYEKIGELDMLTLDDAIDKIKNPDAFVLESETNKNFAGAADKLTIERTKLLFVNQYTDGCEILQPVYNLMGTAENEGGSIEFSARIIAIPEKYTYVAEKDTD